MRRGRTASETPNATMNITMSKFLALGMPLKEIIYRSTWRPAEVIHRTELGHLSEGAVADVAVLSLREGDFGFVDATRSVLKADRQFECQMTLRAGEIVWDLNGHSLPPWEVTAPNA